MSSELLIIQKQGIKMKNNIPQFLKDNLTHKNARPKFFSQDMKQFILDYGKFYEYPNTKNLEGNQLISLWFRYMKSNINDIGFCEYKGCNNKNRIVNNAYTNGFLVSRGCCTQHSLITVMIETYGVVNAMYLQSSKDKIKETNLERYGLLFPNMLSNGYGHKEYKWKTGEISIVQGYEPIVLKELEDSGYTYEMVITGSSRIPTIPYEFENKKHLYYPDIFIPSENLIIEVKSDYTLNKEFDRNKAKFDAVKELGFNFKLEVR